MKIDRFDRIALLFLFGAGLLLGGASLGGRLAIKDPTLSAGGNEAGERGPIGLAFDQRMDSRTVQSRWRITPDISGRFEWQGNTLWFFPGQPLDAGSQYSISLEAGAQSTDGRTLQKDLNWSIRVRQPEVVYLSPAGDTANLWVHSVQGGSPEQLTSLGNVYDFGISWAGDQIAYSAKNAQGGYDIWGIDRNGRNERKLVDCGAAWCNGPVWSADGSRIAYSRIETGSGAGPSSARPGSGANNPANVSSKESRIWTLTLASGQTAPLYSDPQVRGVGPSWSPDGSRLAFFDPIAGGIRVLDLKTSLDTVLPTKTGVVGSWAPDGSYLLYNDLDSPDLPSFGRSFRAEIPAFTITVLFAHGPSWADYGAPMLSPDGKWVAEGIRLLEGSPARQLWLLSQDGSQTKVVSDDPLVTHGAYSWSPDGRMLVFQRLTLGSSAAKPQVVTWDFEKGTEKIIAGNATHPVWIP